MSNLLANHGAAQQVRRVGQAFETSVGDDQHVGVRGCIEEGKGAARLGRKAVLERLGHGHQVRVGLGQPLDGDLLLALGEAGALWVEQHALVS
jgi:hypothetical protein